MSRTALVTGVSGGVGSAVAAAFHAEGWRVVGLDLLEPQADSPLDRFCGIDLAHYEDIVKVVNDLEDEERLDVLVNNAASAMDKPFLEVSYAEWRHTMDVNVGAAFILTQSLFPQLRRARGSVVNVSSVHAIATAPGAAVYCASKGALVALTRALAVELADSGIRVNAILPGAVATPMLTAGLIRAHSCTDVDEALASVARRTPLGVIGEPSEIAEGVLFLADPRRSSFITGQSLIVDGGATARLSTE